MISSTWTKLSTIFSLGIINLVRIFLYKLSIKTGVNAAKGFNSPLQTGDFFDDYIGETKALKPNSYWNNNQTYFGVSFVESSIPIWHKNCLTQHSAPSDLPWYAISDFDNSSGDIKGVWEASRFDWVISFAQQIKNGELQAVSKLNLWLNDWVLNNPTYCGANWKCGQEASIRIMHLALAAILLKQTSNTSSVLTDLIKAHLKRISPTLIYAVAQDNNHGTSEAGALYIGGSWLALNGDKEGLKWKRKGVKWLENRAARLIENDGSFSQYSVNYHRVMLDTYSLVEYWRKVNDLKPFSENLYSKLQHATQWLYLFTNADTGDAPNLGANDGARLIPLTSTDYRDFRPSVQLAGVLFKNALAFKEEGDFNLVLRWLNLKKPNCSFSSKESIDLKDGGYGFLTNEKCSVYLNYPMFNFRPSQCDALHVDVWLGNKNLFRDGGTYSYNAGQKYIDYYGGVESHNTVQFDGHEQMPRLSRFLLGNWLKTSFKRSLKTESGRHSLAAGYRDQFGCSHKRFLTLSQSSLVIRDDLDGFNNAAVLRYRLIPADWRVEGSALISCVCSINFSANVNIKRLELVSGLESRYYYKESQISVLELEIDTAGTIFTEVNF